MYTISQIQGIEWELTTKCNAACPQCVRNFYGGNTIQSLPLVSQSLEQFKKAIPWDQMSSLKQIYFCGTYGDPIACPDLLKICEWLKENTDVNVTVHTNGGLQSVKYWQKLAKVVDKCAFGIDGLEDTNHLYRRNVQWHKLMRNAKAFIDNGGNAIWDFIVFKHNQHQVQEAKTMSSKLGFADFNFKKTHRFLDKKHDLIQKSPVMNSKQEIEYYLEMPTNEEYKNKVSEDYVRLEKQYGSFKEYAMLTNIVCYKLQVKDIYISGPGHVFPCGWLADRMYGHEPENHPDHARMKHLWTSLGGEHKANLFHTPFKEIVEEGWLPLLERTWTNKDRLERCGVQCGSDMTHIKSSAKIKYKNDYAKIT